MSDTKRTKRHSGVTKHESRASIGAVTGQVELRAIEEQFLSEWRAGLCPQISTYMRRYPDYSAEFAAFIALTFIPASQSGMLCVTGDDMPAYQQHVTLSSGTRRALEEIFGADAGGVLSRQLRAAERRAGYNTDAPTPLAEDQGAQDKH